MASPPNESEVTGRDAPSPSLRHADGRGSGEARPFVPERRRVCGSPVLVGWVARKRDGVPPQMVRLKNVIDAKTGHEVYRSAIVGDELLEAWNG